MAEWKSLKSTAGTGWKEIYREAGTGWKELIWDSVPIDVGEPCITRSSQQSGPYTFIIKNNVANANGKITNVCIWMGAGNPSNHYVGTFYQISGLTYKCRTGENVGALSTGENNKTVDLDVVAGDLIGIYLPNVSSQIAFDFGGSFPLLYLGSNTCITDNQSTYGQTNNAAISIYGTG
jgi:hypothetical protein